ncbi:MAG: SpaA isopeptide-forming pilin-related protein [Eubacteriaceae bacterium]|nr:SpaA isopeptide-forming pilin-related protein [Eubacteriaceae bacterium]
MSRPVIFSFPVRDSSQLSVAGCVFMLKDEYGNLLSEARSSDAGIAAFLLKRNRRYLLVQKEAPEGMEIDTTAYSIVVSKAGEITTAFPASSFEIVNRLSAVSSLPLLKGKLSENASVISGKGVDGAIIAIRISKANGSTELYYTAPKSGDWDIKLNSSLKDGDTVECIQMEIGAEESDPVVAVVESAQDISKYIIVMGE